MSDTTPVTRLNQSSSNSDGTSRLRHVDVEPITVRDPLAELLGMVPEDEPLVVTFADVAKAAGHACPAVAGAYRGTQLALDSLYPDTRPIRSKITVKIGSRPDAPGIGPMANVVRHITGAADETGFAGFGGYGGRENLLTFEDDSGQGRSFSFSRDDTDETVRVSFEPAAAGVDPTETDGQPRDIIPLLISGEIPDEEREEFLDQWYARVSRILNASTGGSSPFTLERL